MNRDEKLDVFATYLRTVRSKSSVEFLVGVCARLGPDPRLSDVFKYLGLGEDEFAKVLGEAESRGLLHREQADGRVILKLTLQGRQLFEQAIPQ
jgi:hypothetical protein